ncbi:hypothetical protein GOL41_32210 [Sinorhizobium medicae]|nr:hypothetical protein [Sinorhizobium medicae]
MDDQLRLTIGKPFIGISLMRTPARASTIATVTVSLVSIAASASITILPLLPAASSAIHLSSIGYIAAMFSVGAGVASLFLLYFAQTRLARCSHVIAGIVLPISLLVFGAVDSTVVAGLASALVGLSWNLTELSRMLGAAPASRRARLTGKQIVASYGGFLSGPLWGSMAWEQIFNSRSASQARRVLPEIATGARRHGGPSR